MLDKLLATAVSNAKLVVAGAIGAALVAGGGAVAVTQVASTSDTPPAAAADHPSDHAALKGDNRSDTATAGIELPKTPDTEDTDGDQGAQGVHGACVSAEAHNDSTEGRDHGKAVSAAAKTCPKGDDTAAANTAKADTDDADEASNDADEDAADDSDEAKPVRPAKPAKGDHGRSSEHEPSDD